MISGPWLGVRGVGPGHVRPPNEPWACHPVPGVRIAAGAMVRGAGGDANAADHRGSGASRSAPAVKRPAQSGRMPSIPGCGSRTLVPHSAEDGKDERPAAAAPPLGVGENWPNRPEPLRSGALARLRDGTSPPSDALNSTHPGSSPSRVAFSLTRGEKRKLACLSNPTSYGPPASVSLSPPSPPVPPSKSGGR